ncbi:hypothetical protein IG631_13144 [Alternaria alternata]|nr:hypothetical protein IG631_13144 [Alternaria alternata]
MSPPRWAPANHAATPGSYVNLTIFSTPISLPYLLSTARVLAKTIHLSSIRTSSVLGLHSGAVSIDPPRATITVQSISSLAVELSLLPLCSAAPSEATRKSLSAQASAACSPLPPASLYANIGTVKLCTTWCSTVIVLAFEGVPHHRQAR